MTTLATNLVLESGISVEVDLTSGQIMERRGSAYNDAVSKFSSQTQELKRLLGEEGGEVEATDDDDSVSSGGGEEDEESSGDEDSGSDDESDYDSSDADSDWDSDLEDLEAALQGGEAPSANAAPKILTMPGGGKLKHNLTPALRAMDKKMENEQENILPGIVNLKDRMRQACMNSYLQEVDFTSKTETETLENPFAATKPDEHLKNILEGFSAASFPSETWHDYFMKMTDEHVQAHTTQVEAAIRGQDYDTLRDMLRNGHTLQTCNKHGESIVHIACRRAPVALLDFLINEAGVSTRIRDDMGRTPLHDACWTHKPNFDVIMLLLQTSPELLFIVDHRGATPLTYVPREAWGVWCEFLQENRQYLRDMVKGLRFDRARYFVKNMVPCLKF